MKPWLNQAAIIARRDFIAVVATPTFLLFLLAPLFMILMAALGGTGASKMVATSEQALRIAVLANATDHAAYAASDARARQAWRAEITPPQLEILPAHANDEKVARALFKARDTDYAAVMFGPATRPVIITDRGGHNAASYLAALAEQVARDQAGKLDPAIALSRAERRQTGERADSVRGRQTTGFLAVFLIFFLTLLLAGQAVGMLAEEKSNKVIEILAAAAPLEAVFLGKLIGMFGVALLFVGFWASLGTILVTISPLAGALGGPLAQLRPAVGLGNFVLLGALYFTMAFMLLGAVFLGVGAMASTMREIQMLSLPITIFQVAMFGLSSAAAGAPGTRLAYFAEIFPFSSPFAMAARGAVDPALWPHALALGWQAIWVAATIWLASRLFRRGVLKSGGSLWPRWSKRSRA